MNHMSSITQQYYDLMINETQIDYNDFVQTLCHIFNCGKIIAEELAEEKKNLSASLEAKGKFCYSCRLHVSGSYI